MNTLKTIEARLEKKSVSLASDVKKIENLNAQITQYTNSVTRLEDGLSQKRSEVNLLVGWKEEAEEITRRYDVLGTEMEQIREYYDQIEWTPDLTDDQKLEYNVEYKKKFQERTVIAARLEEIEKLANKTYYRR
jgi:chromosome segregation ATPase